MHIGVASAWRDILAWQFCIEKESVLASEDWPWDTDPPWGPMRPISKVGVQMQCFELRLYERKTHEKMLDLFPAKLPSNEALRFRENIHFFNKIDSSLI